MIIYSFAGRFHLTRKDIVVRDHTLHELVGRGHIHNLLHVTFLLHHIMGRGVAANLPAERFHHIMTVRGAAAEVQIGSVLQLGVTAGALVGAVA